MVQLPAPSKVKTPTAAAGPMSTTVPSGATALRLPWTAPLRKRLRSRFEVLDKPESYPTSS